MRQFTSEAAKSLITIIGTEYAMAQKRVERRFIAEDQMLGTLLERLNRLSCDNVNLRKFLDNVGHIPVVEDESMDLEWAKDPREEIPSTFRGHEDQRSDAEIWPLAYAKLVEAQDKPIEDGKPAPKNRGERGSVLNKFGRDTKI